MGGPERPGFIGGITRDFQAFPGEGVMIFEGSPAIVTEIYWESFDDEPVRYVRAAASLPAPAYAADSRHAVCARSRQQTGRRQLLHNSLP